MEGKGHRAFFVRVFCLCCIIVFCVHLARNVYKSPQICKGAHRNRVPFRSSKTTSKLCRSTTVDNGSHNVSRWMTWLPISLKNAAKCDKWYQLQNLLITESLNANGTRKKPPVVNSEYAMISVSNKTQKTTKQILCLAKHVRALKKRAPPAGAVALLCLCLPLWVR